MESEQDNGTNVQKTDVQGKSATEMTQNQGTDTGAEEKYAERTPKKAEDTPDNKMDSPVTTANKTADTDAEEISAERTPNQAKDIADNNMESSVTTAKEDGVAKGEPTELPPNQGDGTPDETSKEEDGTPDKTVTAGAASNKDTNTDAEEDTSERTQKQGERLDSSVTPAKQEKDTLETEKESSAIPAKEDGDTDAKGEPTKLPPNQRDGTPDNKLTADAASNEGRIAKEEPSEIPPNQGDNTLDNKITADAASKDDRIAKEEPSEIPPNQWDNTLDNKITADASSKDDSDSGAEGEYTESTQKQTKDTHETEKESSATPAKEDGVAKGEPTELPPNQGDGTPDNKLTADVASNEGEVTTENEMGSSLANAKKDVVAKGEPTELPPNQGGGADAEITRKQDIVPNEEPTDLTLNQGKSGKRTSKQEENITENETEFSVTQAKDEGDTDANRKSTEFTPNQGAETDANDKCADRTQKKSRNEKGGEPTEPTLSKGANDSKCLEESPHAEHKNPDSTLTIQTVIDINEGLLIQIEQLKHKIEVIANDRDEKGKGIEEFCKKDIESQKKMFKLREELKALETKHEREMKERNAKINEIEKENNKYKKKDADNEKYKRSVHERINSMSKEIKQRDDNIKKQNEEIKKLNGTVKQLETRRQKYENESKSEIQTLNKNIAKLKAYIKEIESTHKTEVYNLNTDIHAERQNRFALTRKYNDLVQRLHTVEGERHSLTEEKKELLLRLSKVAGANLTYNNPNIADLSDEKRPTKLAEEFSELYDNEWTDVFEELDFETEKGKTNFMLDILKRTNAICSDLSNGHTKRIKDAFCRLTTTSHITLAIVVKQSRLETMEVVPSDQKETKVESVDNDMDLVKKGNNVNNGSHDDDKQIDKALKNKFELDETIEKQDKTDSGKVTESIEMSVQRRENNLEQVREAKRDSIEENKLRIAEPPKDESTAGYSNTLNAGKKEGNHDNNDEKSEFEHSNTEGNPKENEDVTGVETPEAPIIPEAKHDNKDKGHEEKEEGKAEPPKKSELEHSNTEGNPEENEDETGVETPEAPIDESIEGHLNTDNADQNKCKTNEYKKDEIPEAKHDNKDKGHEEKEEGKAEPPKDERTAVNSNMLSDNKNESKANKDKNYEKSKLEQNNMDDNPEGNKEETEVKTSEQTITTEEAHHAGTDKETEKRIEGNALQPKDAANENANEFQSNGTSGQQHDNTDKPPVANQVATPESPIKDKTDSDAMEAPEATHSSMDDVTETTSAIRIESDFELLQKEQKKTIMDAKNFFENQLAKEVETTVADIIGKAFHADSEKTTLKTYIQKCVNICWSMYRHNPPVFIEFPELKESTPFDTNKYKPYTSSGKFIDYIVWPALYLHEDGPLLCKGVAQGLGNKKSK